MKVESIGTFEAKTRFSELIEKVQRGQVFCITKRGKPVARLVGGDDKPVRREAKKPSAWDWYQKIRKGGRKLSREDSEKLLGANRRDLLNRSGKLSS